MCGKCPIPSENCNCKKNISSNIPAGRVFKNMETGVLTTFVCDGAECSGMCEVEEITDLDYPAIFNALEVLIESAKIAAKHEPDDFNYVCLAKIASSAAEVKHHLSRGL